MQEVKIQNLVLNVLTQEQFEGAEKDASQLYLTPDTSIDSSEKGAANGVASLDPNGKVPAEQIPVATTSTLGGVKPDGNTITVTEDGTLSAAGGSGTGEFDYVVETYTDEQGNWYRKYKSGWLEQGGVATSDNVTLLKPMENANYSVYMSQSYNAGGYSAYPAQPHNRTTTSFSYFQYQGYFNAFWYVCGKGAN